MKIYEEWRETARRLSTQGISNADREAQELVARAAACPPDVLPARWRDPFPESSRPVLDLFTVRRLSGTPLAHLLGEWDFLDFTVTVTPDVLIPRPETEELFERVERAGAAEWDRSDREAPLLVDCGTGSGVLALALARRWPRARVVATDISSAALAVARWNAERLGAADRVRFAEGDLVSLLPDGAVDGLVANLPYVADGEWAGLSPEVRREPRQALLGGPDGLSLYRRLAPEAVRVLRPGGRVFLEVGRGQTVAVAALLTAAGLRDVGTALDSAGLDRFVWGTR